MRSFRGSLHGTAEQHQHSYGQAVADVTGAMRYITLLLNQGSCRVAFRQLKMVQRRMGSLAANCSYSEDYGRSETCHAAVDRLDERMASLWTRWAQGCVKPERR